MRLSYIFLLTYIFLPSIITAQTTDHHAATYRRTTFEELASNPVLVAAHRGDWRNHPENSIAAIESVIEMGADIVEVDVQRTSDGFFILMHDETVNRTTNGRGRVSKMTMAQISELFLRDQYGYLTEHKVPTLKEALDVCRDRIIINLDQAYSYHDEIYELVIETGTIENVLFKASITCERVIKDFEKFPHPKPHFMPVVDLRHNKRGCKEIISGHINNGTCQMYEVLFSNLTPRVKRRFRKLNNSGIRIWATTIRGSMCGHFDDNAALINPEISYGRLINEGVSIFQTDNPQLLLDYLRSKDLHN